jgi:hypothetical protein
MKDKLWHRVLKEKYFPSSSVVTWLRRPFVSTPKASNTWRSLLKYFHVVAHWIAWKPGSGMTIRLGEDTILGLGKRSFLSQGLIDSLRLKGCHFLYQMEDAGRQGVVMAHWKSDSEMGLVGSEATEWDRFCRALDHAGIYLTDSLDELIWTRGNASGVITAKNAYDAIASKIWNRSENWWHCTLWKWDLAPKLKLFTWILLENRILTWENLQRRGRHGPGLCVLCQQDSETTLHMMVHCKFAQHVWKEMLAVHNINGGWFGINLQMCFKDWCCRHPKWHMMPSLICWQIWLERNLVIF